MQCFSHKPGGGPVRGGGAAEGGGPVGMGPPIGGNPGGGRDMSNPEVGNNKANTSKLQAGHK